MKKTFGGNRLGAGGRMEFETKHYERSTFDLSRVFRSTMASGTLVPFISELALTGDTFDINLSLDVMTHPTVGPLFGSYKAQLDIFQCPIRLYNSLLHNNMLGIGKSIWQVIFPTITLEAKSYVAADDGDINISQVNPSCILAYQGIRGVGMIPPNETGTAERSFNALPILGYWDIYKNYYSFKQSGQGAVIHSNVTGITKTITNVFAGPTGAASTPILENGGGAPFIINSANQEIEITWTGAGPTMAQLFLIMGDGKSYPIEEYVGNWVISTGIATAPLIYNPDRVNVIVGWRYMTQEELTNGVPIVELFDLEDIDSMREAILTYNSRSTAFELNTTSLKPYSNLWSKSGDLYAMQTNQEGLGIKTYQSDIFNNWLDSASVDAINSLSSVDVTGGSFTMDTFLLAKKIYELYNDIQASGDSYDDWLDAVYDETRWTRCESPMYMGGMSQEVVFQEVVSNSAAEDQPLGSLAGKGMLSRDKKGGSVHIKVDEPSYIIGIVSLTPRIDYSQGNTWDVNLKTMDDIHKPAMDNIGFQDAILEKFAWWTTMYDSSGGPGNEKWVQKSAGKQPAWIDYMTSYNRTFGNFAIDGNEMFMTLNRKYDWTDQGNDYNIRDLTPYIDPALFNEIFAETARDAQNFWVQIGIDINARRKMSSKIMPRV